MNQSIVTIQSNRMICNSLFKMDFILNNFSTPPLPGQFLTIRIGNTISPLLRRPFGFSDFDNKSNKASIIYQIRGQGTKLLSTYKSGTALDIIGSLGNHFPLPPHNYTSLLIAGGIGIGPILFLASMLKQTNRKFKLIFGCRSSEWLPESILTPLNATVCTDDGSYGFGGTPIDYLRQKTLEFNNNHLYCCGPHPMLRACHYFAQEKCIPCFVSVEQTMACGVGACMGCAVKMTGSVPYARACKEGPVFNSKDIAWD